MCLSKESHRSTEAVLRVLVDLTAVTGTTVSQAKDSKGASRKRFQVEK